MIRMKQETRNRKLMVSAIMAINVKSNFEIDLTTKK